MTAAAPHPDPRAQYGTPLLYRPHRPLLGAIEATFKTLSAAEPAPSAIPPDLKGKAWQARRTRGALCWWIRWARARDGCRTSGGRGRLVDAFLAYREARADLMTALLVRGGSAAPCDGEGASV